MDKPTVMGEAVSLLPCPLPWCDGGAQVLGFGVRFYAVCCKSCGLEGPKENERDDAIAAWNTRVSTNKDETIAKLRAEIINTPETADFMAGVPLEAAHQRERWGTDHDAGKSPFDWFWLIGYLSQKAAASAVAGDVEKARHHTISTAAALANWHAALTGKSTAMRPGTSLDERFAA